MKETIARLAKIFCLDGDVTAVSVIGNGNINSTYDVTVTANGKPQRYVFQKINVFVFKDPQSIMQNIERVTAHIAEKLAAEGKSRDGVMHFAHTVYGKNYYMEENGFWRVSEYVPNTVTFNDCADLDKLRSAGYAFGNFQNRLADFDASSLCETIAGFHDTRARLKTFFRHVEEDPCGRVCEVKEEIARIAACREKAEKLCVLIERGEIPLRVTHNDTKINNVLFDADTGDAKTVIDLDTVMPGLVAYDFGDAVRFAANTAAEDERDLSKVSLDMARFSAFSEGFLSAVGGTLTPVETETLALGAFVMTVELAVRFLDDYIVGDKYFKNLYPGHNLVRTRCQLALADDIEAHFDQMNAIVLRVAEAAKR